MTTETHEPELAAPPSDGKMYSPQQIGVAAFLGTPLAGCWLLSRNFLVLGQPRRARNAVVGGLLGTVLLFVVAFQLPEKTPKQLLPILYTVIVRELAKHYQGSAFRQHLAKGGLRQSNWRVLGLGLAAAVATILAVFAFVSPD